MIVGIDARPLSSELSGIGIYILELLQYFVMLNDENTYVLFSNRKITVDIPVSESIIIYDEYYKSGQKWLNVEIPILLKKFNIDLFWGTDHFLPPKTNHIKYVLTVHDLAVYIHPQFGNCKNILRQRLYLKPSCKNADKIIAISNSTKNDLMKYLNVNEDKIEVIYNGDSPYKSESKFSSEENNSVLKKYNLNSNYILFIGTISPRKNVDMLVQGFDYLKKHMNTDVKLLIAGSYGWKCKKTVNLINNSDYNSDIIVTGYISEKEKEIFYRNASIFVFPSLYEGFGFPILEALSVGIPTITLKNSSLPEVGGSACYYLTNSNDYSKLAILMEKILKNDLDLNLEKHICDGFKQVAKFSRKQCAYETLKLFDKLCREECNS